MSALPKCMNTRTASMSYMQRFAPVQPWLLIRLTKQGIVSSLLFFSFFSFFSFFFFFFSSLLFSSLLFSSLLFSSLFVPFLFFSFLLLFFYAKDCGAGRPGSKPHPSNQLHKDAAVLISGCMDAETSADSTAPSDPTRACGAMTNALVTVVREHYYNYPSTPLTNKSALLFFICQVCS